MVLVENSIDFWIDLAHGTVSALRVVGLDFDSALGTADNNLESLDFPPSEVVFRINQLLDETQRAFEDSDTVEIGDILEYDLPPLLVAYQSILRNLSTLCATTLH
jgi:hypothetical protein